MKKKQKNLQPAQKLTQKEFDGLMSALNQTALVSVTDEKGNIIYANEKFIKVSKYSLKELLGQNHRILKSGHQSQKLFDDLWKTISKGKVWRGEIKNKAKDGTYYWVDTSIAPILNERGKPERYISVRFLITDKKKVADKLSDQIENLKKVNDILVGRELKMIALKEEIKRLKENSESLQES